MFGRVSVRLFALFAILLVVCPSLAFAQKASAPHSPVGTNLTRIDDYSTDFAFLDVFKTSRPWVSRTRSYAESSRPLDVDAHGWVRSLQADQIATTRLFWDLSRAPGRYPPGRYVVTYEGEGSVEYGGSAVVAESRPGRQVIDVDPARGGGIEFNIVAVDPANYLRNISVRMPSSAPDSEIFNPAFVERVRAYKVLRFKDWMATDGEWSPCCPSTQHFWSGRPKVDDARWSELSGVPVEIMAALANRTAADAWFNMPHQADDDYVKQFAETALRLLSPNSRVYVEYSNEVWNNQFAQATYAQSQGLALGLSTDPFQAQVRYQALRSRQIFDIWESVFPKDRLVRVLSSFHVVPSVTQELLSFGDTRAHTDVLAIAPYFGIAGEDAPVAVGMSLDALMRHLDSVALPQSNQYTQQHVDIARRYGLPVIAYEAGLDLQARGSVYQQDPTMNALFDAANRDPRIGPIYMRYLQDWNTMTGGQLLVHFIDCEAFSVYGRYGTLEYLDQPRSQAPKFDSLMRWIEQTA
jgi:hypothetical protein